MKKTNNQSSGTATCINSFPWKYPQTEIHSLLILQVPACGPANECGPSASPVVQSNFYWRPWSSTLQFTTNTDFSLNFKYLTQHSEDLKRAQPSLFIFFRALLCWGEMTSPQLSSKGRKVSSPHAADTSKAHEPFMNQMNHKRTQAERSNCSLWAFISLCPNPHLTWTHRKVFSALHSLPQITPSTVTSSSIYFYANSQDVHQWGQIKSKQIT